MAAVTPHLASQDKIVSDIMREMNRSVHDILGEAPIEPLLDVSSPPQQLNSPSDGPPVSSLLNGHGHTNTNNTNSKTLSPSDEVFAIIRSYRSPTDILKSAIITDDLPPSPSTRRKQQQQQQRMKSDIDVKKKKEKNSSSSSSLLKKRSSNQSSQDKYNENENVEKEKEKDRLRNTSKTEPQPQQQRSRETRDRRNSKNFNQVDTNSEHSSVGSLQTKPNNRFSSSFSPKNSTNNNVKKRKRVSEDPSSKPPRSSSLTTSPTKKLKRYSVKEEKNHTLSEASKEGSERTAPRVVIKFQKNKIAAAVVSSPNHDHIKTPSSINSRRGEENSNDNKKVNDLNNSKKLFSPSLSLKDKNSRSSDVNNNLNKSKRRIDRDLITTNDKVYPGEKRKRTDRERDRDRGRDKERDRDRDRNRDRERDGKPPSTKKVKREREKLDPELQITNPKENSKSLSRKDSSLSLAIRSERPTSSKRINDTNNDDNRPSPTTERRKKDTLSKLRRNNSNDHTSGSGSSRRENVKERRSDRRSSRSGDSLAPSSRTPSRDRYEKSERRSPSEERTNDWNRTKDREPQHRGEKIKERAKGRGRDTERERERERDRNRGRDRNREKDRGLRDDDWSRDSDRGKIREKERSRDRDKGKGSDKDRNRDKERGREREGRDREKSRNRERERENDRDEDRSRDRGRDKETARGDRDRDRARDNFEREKHSDRGNEKDKPKESKRPRERARDKVPDKDNRAFKVIDVGRTIEKDDRSRGRNRDWERDDERNDERNERDADPKKNISREKSRDRNRNKDRERERDEKRERRNRERNEGGEKTRDRARERTRERDGTPSVRSPDGNHRARKESDSDKDKGKGRYSDRGRENGNESMESTDRRRNSNNYNDNNNNNNTIRKSYKDGNQKDRDDRMHKDNSSPEPPNSKDRNSNNITDNYRDGDAEIEKKERTPDSKPADKAGGTGQGLRSIIRSIPPKGIRSIPPSKGMVSPSMPTSKLVNGSAKKADVIESPMKPRTLGLLGASGDPSSPFGNSIGGVSGASSVSGLTSGSGLAGGFLNFKRNGHITMSQAKAKTKDLYAAFKTAKTTCTDLFRKKEYDKYEENAKNLIIICFELALAEETEIRLHEDEFKRGSVSDQKHRRNSAMDKYRYMTQKLVPNIISELESIRRDKTVQFCRRAIQKVFLRMFFLQRLWNKDLKNSHDSVSKTFAELRGKDLGVDSKQFQTAADVVEQFFNGLRIAESIIMDTGDGHEEAGSECAMC